MQTAKSGLTVLTPTKISSHFNLNLYLFVIECLLRCLSVQFLSGTSEFRLNAFINSR